MTAQGMEEEEVTSYGAFRVWSDSLRALALSPEGCVELSVLATHGWWHVGFCDAARDKRWHQKGATDPFDQSQPQGGI
jgi:hypothetical protein